MRFIKDRIYQKNNASFKIFISQPEYQQSSEPRHFSSCIPPPGDYILNQAIQNAFDLSQRVTTEYRERTCLGISWRIALASLNFPSGPSSSWLSWTGSRTPPGMYRFRSRHFSENDVIKQSVKTYFCVKLNIGFLDYPLVRTDFK